MYGPAVCHIVCDFEYFQYGVVVFFCLRIGLFVHPCLGGGLLLCIVLVLGFLLWGLVECFSGGEFRPVVYFIVVIHHVV